MPRPVAAPPTWRSVVRDHDDADPVALTRIAAVNAAAWDFWCHQGAESTWVRSYLTERGLAAVVTAAHAPAGWTTTIDHLHNAGFTDDALLEAGIATRARTGRLIDRFRDRLPLPVHDGAGRIAGFTARANPTNLAFHPDTPST